MQFYFTVNVGRKFRDSSWCPFNRGGPLNTGFTVYKTQRIGNEAAVFAG